MREVTDEVVEAFGVLLPQLSSSAPPADRAALERVVGSGSTTLLVARSGGKIAGTLSLVMFPIPTGLRAWIEDVIVDEAARGQGIGQRLTAEALRIAEDAGARTVDLTSRPSREAAAGSTSGPASSPARPACTATPSRPPAGRLTRRPGPGGDGPARPASGRGPGRDGQPASSATAASSRSTSDRSL